MPREKLPIGTDAFKNVDDVVLNANSPMLVDAYTNEFGATVKRPGLNPWIDLGTTKPVEGLYWWEWDQSVIAVSDGKVFRITAMDGSRAEISLGGDALEPYTTTGGKMRPTFAEVDTYIFIANGKLVYYPDAGSKTDYVHDADVDAPTHVHWVVGHDKYVICDDGEHPQRFVWSGVGTPLLWNPVDFAHTESKSDDLMFIASAWREIYMAGSDSIETWYDDGSTPFARLEGAYTEDGVLASNSVCLFDGMGIYLSKDRRVKILEGRTPKPISGPFDQYLQSLTTAYDAIGNICMVAGRKFYILSFPTENKTLVVDLTRAGSPGQGWSEWGAWNGSTYDRFLGQSFCYAIGWKMMLVGSKTDGKIFKMDAAYYKDDATAIRAIRRTGHVDRGTMARKRCNRLLLKVKRGEGNADITEPVLKIRWRDDMGAWTNYISVSLGVAADTKNDIELYRLGIYRTRQWEFVQDEKCGLTLVDVEEDYEVLTS